MSRATIGIIAHNVDCLLIQCISSVMEQTFSDIEIIVADNGSTDESGYIADQFAAQDERLSVIHMDSENLAAAREAVLNKMTTDFVYWVDGADSLQKTALETVWRIYEDTGADIVKTVLSPEERRYAGGYDRRAFMRLLLPGRVDSCMAGTLTRKNLYKYQQHNSLSDMIDIFPALVDNAGMIVIDDSASYTRNEAVAKNATTSSEYCREALRLGEKYEKYHEEFPEETKPVLQQFINYACMGWLLAENDNDILPVRILIEKHERAIMMNPDIIVYSKWLLRKVISNSAFVISLRGLHEKFCLYNIDEVNKRITNGAF